MYDQDNLGIYDTNNIDVNDSANIQGVSFMDYRTKFTKSGSNEHELLTKSSSPKVGSIVEAMNGSNSVEGYQSAAQQTLSTDEAAFNVLISRYTTAYNNYISSTYMTKLNNGIAPSTTDSSNNDVIEDNLKKLNDELLILATKIVGQINSLKTNTDDVLRESIEIQKESLTRRIAELQTHRNNLNHTNTNFDRDSVDGAIETTTLNLDAFYVHFIVYLFIGAVLIVFIFNISVNPEANTTKATFFIVALFSVYIISRWVNK